MHSTTHAPIRVPLELIEKLDIVSPEDAAVALTRTLSLIESFDPRKFVAFTAYYGLEGFTAARPQDIAEGLGINSTAVVSLIGTVEELVDEELRMLRCARTFSNAYDSWPLEDFFTISRALKNNVSLASATRIRNLIRKEKVDFPTVRHFRTLTENGLLQIPDMGRAMVKSIKAMLESVDYSLATH